MKKIVSLALVAMLAMGTVSTAVAQDKEKCKKENCHKCSDKCKDHCKDGKCTNPASCGKCDDKKGCSKDTQKVA